MCVTFSTVAKSRLTRCVDDSVDALVERLEKTSPALLQLLDLCIKDIRDTLLFAEASDVVRPITIDPLLLENRSTYFSNGVCFMAVKKTKRSDVLAAGGR